jgi:hypothetical protein
MAEVFENLSSFNSTLRITKLLFDGLHPDRVMFSGISLSATKLYLLYDRDNGHYDVITNLTGAMAKRYICNACDTIYDYTSVTKFPPCVLLRHPVLKINPSIVPHVTAGFSVRTVFRII